MRKIKVLILCIGLLAFITPGISFSLCVPDGDVAPLGNRDGRINIGDALVVLRFALALETPTIEDKCHADVAPLSPDGTPQPDGQITIGDALVVLRKALALIDWQVSPPPEGRASIRVTPEGLSGIYLVEVLVDLNGDGDYMNDGVVYWGSANGSESISFAILVNENSTTRALVRVESKGFAPWEKVIDFKNGISVNLSPKLKPVSKIRVTSSQIQLTRAAGGRVFFGLTKDGKAFAGAGTRATQDMSNVAFQVALGANIPLNGTIIAELGYFNGNQTEAFPGDFVGQGYPSGRSGSEEQRLQSVAFAYISLEDESGNILNLPSVNATRQAGTCNGYEYVLQVPPDQIGVLRDDQPGLSGYQVPVWAYIDGRWRYLGEGDLYYANGTAVEDNAVLDPVHSYHVKFCSSSFYSWCNLDYVIFAQPRTVCIWMKDPGGKPVSGVEIEVQGRNEREGYSDRGYTDLNGIARVVVLTPLEANTPNYVNANYAFFYGYWGSSGFGRSAISANVTVSGTTGCDFELRVTYPRQILDARIRVEVQDENGNPMEGELVEIMGYGSDGSYFWNTGFTNATGEVVLEARSNVLYDVMTSLGSTLSQAVRVDGTKNYQEDYDNGSEAGVMLTYVNNPPMVSVWPSAYSVREGNTVSFWVSAWDPEGESLSLAEAVINGSPVNGTVNQCGPGYCEWLFQGVASGTNLTFRATVRDAAGKSASAETTVMVFVDNRPPQIYSVLGPTLVTAGSSASYTAYVWDPDGDLLSYRWYLKNDPDGTYQAIGQGTTMTHTFQTAGIYYMKLEVDDGQGHVISREWTVTASSQGITDRIIIRTGLEGLYVTRHDPKTLAPVEVRQTDASGVVTFAGVTSPVPISVALTPDLVVSPDMLFARAAERVAYLTNAGLCKSTCEEALNGTLPVACIQAIIEQFYPGSNCTAASGDINQDGYLDKTELYNLKLACADANGDGKLQLKESRKNVKVDVQMVLTVPPGDYDLTTVEFFSHGYADATPDTGIYCGWWATGFTPSTSLKTVTWQVKNVSSGMTGLQVVSGETIDYWWNNGTNTMANGILDLYEWDLQNDGNYTLLFYDNNYNYLWLLDQSSDNVTVDYNSFQPPKQVSLINSTSGSWVMFWTVYKGVNWHLPTYDIGNGTLFTVDIPFGTPIKVTLFSGENFSSNPVLEERNYYADLSFNAMPSTLDFNRQMLNVDLTSSGWGSFSFSGPGLSEVNEMNYVWEREIRIFDPVTRSVTEYDVDIDVSGYGVPSSGSWSPDWSQILPQPVYSYVSQVNQMYNQYQNTSGTSGHSYETLMLNAYPDVTDLQDWVQSALQGTLWTLDKKGISYSRDLWWDNTRSRRSSLSRRQILKPWQREGWFKPLR
ncbi:dockerin type I repeat-containing protein [Thermosulfurimonas dismutans]|nr:dockerin type I repeat-containing protein [Thermosulfurimonas dismutans]